jgi:Fe2+ transport system protein B
MTEETVAEEYEERFEEGLSELEAEVPAVDQQAVRIANYMDNLNKEIKNLTQELLKVQYALDIRITAKNAYTNAMQKEPKVNGEDEDGQDREDGNKA